MSSVGAGFRLARAGWVLVREGVIAALPGEELSGLPKFGWRLARLFTRRRALAYERSDLELEIERVGDEIRIRPARRPLAGVLKKFAKFSPDFMADGRGEQEQAEREGL